MARIKCIIIVAIISLLLCSCSKVADYYKDFYGDIINSEDKSDNDTSKITCYIEVEYEHVPLGHKDDLVMSIDGKACGDSLEPDGFMNLFIDLPEGEHKLVFNAEGLFATRKTNKLSFTVNKDSNCFLFKIVSAPLNGYELTKELSFGVPDLTEDTNVAEELTKQILSALEQAIPEDE